MSVAFMPNSSPYTYWLCFARVGARACTITQVIDIATLWLQRRWGVNGTGARSTVPTPISLPAWNRVTTDPGQPYKTR